MTPLPGAVPGLVGPDDEFGNESTRVMQNELVQSLADRTRDKEDLANAFSDPEPTRKASVEELKLAVQGSAIERTEPPKAEAKVEVAKEEAKPAVAAAEAKEEAKPAAAAAIVVEEKKAEAKAEAKPADKKEPVAQNAKHKKNKGQDEKRADGNSKNSEAKKADGDKKSGEHKQVKPADKKDDRAVTAAPTPLRMSEPPRKRSALPLYAGVAVVALVGGYTIFRNGAGGDDTPKPAQQQQQAAVAPAQPEGTKVAQADTAKPTEPLAAEAKGDRPQAAATPAETPNPGKPDKEPTAAAAVEKPAGLSVAITSDPAGASVTLDGKAVEGVTPTALAGLDAKKVYAVKLSLKGFHDWKVKLKPKAGDKIDAALVPNEKVVEVASTPAGADVMLDGKRVGKTPFTIHKLDLSKTHALELKRAGFVTQSRSISASDTFESKGDKDVLAVAMTLEAQPKSAAADKPVTATPVVAKQPRPASHRPAAVKKPVVEPAAEKPVEAAGDKPAATDKPVVAEKPVVADKPAAAEKPVADKPAADDKPAETTTDKPAGGDKAGIKVPSWMKQKQPEGGSGDKAAAAPPASDAPTP